MNITGIILIILIIIGLITIIVICGSSNEMITNYLKTVSKQKESVQREYIIISLISLVIIVLVLSIFVPYHILNNWDYNFYEKRGVVGDAIGGIMNPIVAIAGIGVTFLAFYIQYKANKAQTKQFENQANDIKLERFKSIFFEMVNLHKSNVNEMNIAGSIYGRKCFVPMFYEFRICYKYIETEVLSTPDEIRLKYNYAEINILNLAYKIFFYGIGKNSEMNYVPYLNENEKYLFDIIKKTFNLFQIEYIFISTNANPKRKYYSMKINESNEEIDLFYYPFDGHINILGHYFRHLFQTVNFVISQDFLDSNEKYNYLKILRAQLSNFEQLMLYYNAIIWFDDEWREAFTEYRFIKNLPIPMTLEIGPDPRIFYAKEIELLNERGIAMFELDEK